MTEYGLYDTTKPQWHQPLFVLIILQESIKDRHCGSDRRHQMEMTGNMQAAVPRGINAQTLYSICSEMEKAAPCTEQNVDDR